MRRFIHIKLRLLFTLVVLVTSMGAQNIVNPAPYCNGPYSTGLCNQPGASNAPGNFINDFIDCVQTSGANNNINNCNSGCNGGPNNYNLHCSHYLQVAPGQTISVLLKSGNTYAQGFAIFIDWNQDNIFNVPAEYVAGTAAVPPAATTVIVTFTVPANQAPGSYRMRIRCAFATPGPNITPCGVHGFGETEDYTIYVGAIPPNAGIVTATATVNSPICAGQSINLNAVSGATSGITYTWTGPGGYSNTAQSPVIANASFTASGVYSVVASNGGACAAYKTVTVQVIPYPTFSLAPLTKTICQGGSLTASVVLPFGTNPSQYSYSWSPSGAGIFNPFLQNTNITPLLLPVNVTQSTIIYSVAVTPTVLGCTAATTLAVTINNPLTPTLTMPQPVCNTYAPIQLMAIPGGGTWSANSIAVSPNGILNPALANLEPIPNIASYSFAAGACIVSNTVAFSVSKYISPALSSSLSTICVQDAPKSLMSLVQNTLNGQWSGIGVNNPPNFFNPIGLATGNYSLKYKTRSDPPIMNICPDSVFLLVSVFNPPTPIIASISDKCNTSGTVTLSASPLGGIWSLNSGVNSLGVQTPSLCGIGTNSVTYTAGQGTCVASSSATFHVSKFNTASLSNTVLILCASSNPYNLMSVVQNTNGYWTGINTSTNNFFNPAALPSNTFSLIYTTYSTPNPTLCGDSKTIIASVLNPQTPNISVAGPYCSKGGPVQMSVTPNTGYWNATSYLSATGVLTPSLCAIGSNNIQYIVGTSTCNATQTRTVNVEAFVPATLNNNIPDLCNTGSAFSLLPLTINNLGVWSGPGVTGANFLPSVTGAGQYILTYQTASSPGGLCTDASTISVKVFSLATPQLTKVGPFCNNSPPIQLQVSPVGGVFGGANTSAINYSGIFNPGLAAQGGNIINYSISAGPCIAYAQATINVEHFVSANFDKYLDPLCKNNEVVDLNSLVQNPGGIWSSSSPGLVGSKFYPSKANIGSDNIINYQTFSSANNFNLCPDRSTIQINVIDIPTVTINSVNSGICAPVEVFFNTPSINGNKGKGTWYLNDGSEPQNGLFISHTFKSPGTYSVVFNYISEEGCSSQKILDVPIKVFESPSANFIFEPDELSISNPEVNLTNLSSALSKNKYRWTLDSNTELSDISLQTQFNQIGIHKVTLLAISPEGCKDEITKTIEVKNDFNVFIPNSFTPNSDGLNDEFSPVFSKYGLDSRTFEMQIFDRWGKSIYSTKDVTKGWDGSLNNKGDVLLKEDNYVYKLRYKDLEGRIYDKTGHITLLNK